jgi:hypothetical protein
MAHFANLDNNNTVVNVIVVNNEELLEDGIESETKGIAFCMSLFPDTNWKQTSYNGTFRKHYANPGFTYNNELDAFIPPKPYSDWILDTKTCTWVAPLPYPDDGVWYIWSTEQATWVTVQSYFQE